MNITKQELKVLRMAFDAFDTQQKDRNKGCGVPQVKADCNANIAIADNLLDRFLTELTLPKGPKR
jgi:hypothetical protein